MANKKRRRRTSLLTKGINIGVLLLAFSRPIELALAGNYKAIGEEATGGLSFDGKFRPEAAIRFYGPMLGAIVLKKAVSMVRKTARV